MKYKYKLEDFEVVHTHIPQDNDDSYITKASFKAVPGYEVFKLHKIWFKKVRPYAPALRREKLEDVIKWLQVETGATEKEIKETL